MGKGNEKERVKEEEGMGGHVLVSFLEHIVFFQNRFGNEVTYVKFARIFSLSFQGSAARRQTQRLHRQLQGLGRFA